MNDRALVYDHARNLSETHILFDNKNSNCIRGLAVLGKFSRTFLVSLQAHCMTNVGRYRRKTILW